jgi:hypothetical protein
VLRPYGVIEMVRTGRVEMARGTMPAPVAAALPAAIRAQMRDLGDSSV